MESHQQPIYRFGTVSIPLVLEIADYESAWAGGEIRDEFPKITGSSSYILDTDSVDTLQVFQRKRQSGRRE